MLKPFGKIHEGETVTGGNGMKKTVIIAALGMAVICSGCMSAAVAFKTNREYTQRIIKGEMKDGIPTVGADLLSLWQAYKLSWQQSPGLTASALFGDVVIAGATVWMSYEQGKTSRSDESTSAAAPNTVSGDIVIFGNYNSIEHVWENEQ